MKKVVLTVAITIGMIVGTLGQSIVNKKNELFDLDTTKLKRNVLVMLAEEKNMFVMYGNTTDIHHEVLQMIGGKAYEKKKNYKYENLPDLDLFVWNNVKFEGERVVVKIVDDKNASTLIVAFKNGSDFLD